MTIDELWRWLKKKLFGPARPTGMYCGRCGEPLTSREFCRECGASEESGWSEGYVGEETEDDFDYDDYVRREFGGQPRAGRSFSGTWVLVLFIILIAGMILLQLGTVRY